MLLWPTKALLEIILYDLRPFGMEGIYCFDLIKAEKLIWHPVVKETNSHTKENSCDGIIQTIQVTLERKKGFSSKDLYSTHYTTVEIKIIALYAYWKAVFNLEKKQNATSSSNCQIQYFAGTIHINTPTIYCLFQRATETITQKMYREGEGISLVDGTMINTPQHIPHLLNSSSQARF